jgi:HK97 gp10 family phage protein
MPVDGLREFERKFAQIPELVRAQVRAELEEIAEQVVAQMYAQAPHSTGDLAGSIQWTWGDAPAGALTIGTVGGREFGSMRITIFAGGGDQFYARFQEFGTVNMPASPFFFPVWRVNRRRVRGRITRAIKKAVRLA